jgi:hypothetical protein
MGGIIGTMKPSKRFQFNGEDLRRILRDFWVDASSAVAAVVLLHFEPFQAFVFDYLGVSETDATLVGGVVYVVMVGLGTATRRFLTDYSKK